MQSMSQAIARRKTPASASGVIRLFFITIRRTFSRGISLLQWSIIAGFILFIGGVGWYLFQQEGLFDNTIVTALALLIVSAL